MQFAHNFAYIGKIFEYVDRNLSFETDEDNLATFMSQFGDVIYCRLVLNPTTDHSKGVACNYSMSIN